MRNFSVAFIVWILFSFHADAATIRERDAKNSSDIVRFYLTPKHIHLSTGFDASSTITISFSSYNLGRNVNALLQPRDNKNGTESFLQSPTGVVLIGTDPKNLRLVRGKKGIHYNATIYRKNGNEVKYRSDYQHHVSVLNLEPNTKYYYMCGVTWDDENFSNELMDCDNEDDEECEQEIRRLGRQVKPRKTDFAPKRVFQFKTAPPPGKRGSKDKVAIIGDVGIFSHSMEMFSILAQPRFMKKIGSVILAGDISYANGDHRRWDDFFDMLDNTDIFHQKPLYIAAGNHDAEGDLKTGDLFVAFENRFRMPQVAPAIVGRSTHKQDVNLNAMYKLPYDYGNSYYSYIRGPCHNIILNAFANFEPGSPQYKWFVKELKKVNRNRENVPWVSVTVHCPMYNTFSLHQKDPQPLALRKYIEPLLVQYKVNFVFSGHLHAYMRTKNVAFASPKFNGPVHIILGNGGHNLQTPYQNDSPEDWVAVRDHTTYGFVVVEYLNSTSAKYEWIHTGHGDYFNVTEDVTDTVFVENQFWL